jgi:hypothetical protein
VAAVPQEIIQQLRDHGIRLFCLGDDRLAAEPASRLTDDARNLIRQHKTELLRLLRPTRPIVEYRCESDSTWHTMLGRPGETFEAAEAVCRQQFADVVETRPRHISRHETLSDDFGPEAA